VISGHTPAVKVNGVKSKVDAVSADIGGSSKSEADNSSPAMLETNSNFEKEHKSKLMLISVLIAAISWFVILIGFEVGPRWFSTGRSFAGVIAL